MTKPTTRKATKPAKGTSAARRLKGSKPAKAKARRPAKPAKANARKGTKPAKANARKVTKPSSTRSTPSADFNTVRPPKSALLANAIGRPAPWLWSAFAALRHEAEAGELPDAWDDPKVSNLTRALFLCFTGGPKALASWPRPTSGKPRIVRVEGDVLPPPPPRFTTWTNALRQLQEEADAFVPTAADCEHLTRCRLNVYLLVVERDFDAPTFQTRGLPSRNSREKAMLKWQQTTLDRLGQLEPIRLFPAKAGRRVRLLVVAGRQRTKAFWATNFELLEIWFQGLKWQSIELTEPPVLKLEVDCMILHGTLAEALETGAVLNTGRPMTDVERIEEAIRLRGLKDTKTGKSLYTIQEIADILSCSVSGVNNYLGVLRLHPDLLRQLFEGGLKLACAFELVSFAHERQLELWALVAGARDKLAALRAAIRPPAAAPPAQKQAAEPRVAAARQALDANRSPETEPFRLLLAALCNEPGALEALPPAVQAALGVLA